MFSAGRIVTKGGEEGNGFFFPNMLFMFSQECLENRHVSSCFYSFELLFCLLCAVDAPASGKEGQEAGGCKSHLSVLCIDTSVGDWCCCLPEDKGGETVGLQGKT